MDGEEGVAWGGVGSQKVSDVGRASSDSRLRLTIRASNRKQSAVIILGGVVTILELVLLLLWEWYFAFWCV